MTHVSRARTWVWTGCGVWWLKGACTSPCDVIVCRCGIQGHPKGGASPSSVFRERGLIHLPLPFGTSRSLFCSHPPPPGCLPPHAPRSTRCQSPPWTCCWGSTHPPRLSPPLHLAQVNSMPVSSLDMLGPAGSGASMMMRPSTATAGMPAPVQAALLVSVKGGQALASEPGAPPW